MAVATLTSKGQMTIPKQVRQALQLRSGDKIEIIVTTQHEAILRPLSKKVDDVFGRLGKTGKSASINEMDDAIRNRMRKNFS